jgi:predicted transcriptional regulator
VYLDKSISAIKESAHGMPIWIIAHTPAPSASRDKNVDMKARGATAFTGDSQATLFIYQELEHPDTRFIRLDKHRFVEDFDLIEFSGEVHKRTVETDWGVPQIQSYRVGWPSKSSKADIAAKRIQSQEDSKLGEEAAFRMHILDVVEKECSINMTNLKKMIGGKQQRVSDVVAELVEDGLLIKQQSGRQKLITLPPKNDGEIELDSQDLNAA